MIRLRNATIADASFLAHCLVMALRGVMDATTMELLTSLCERDDTLYSWRFGTIAETAQGERVGASIAYPGADYRERRAVSFRLAASIINFDVASMEDEAVAGELYLDTLAVLPSHRGRGIATTLLRHWLAEAERQGLSPTLACARDNARAYKLYMSLGLRETGSLFIFGDYYRKMSYSQP